MLIAALSDRFYRTGNDASLSNTWYLADKDHFTVSVDGKTKQEISDKIVKAVAEITRVCRDGSVRIVLPRFVMRLLKESESAVKKDIERLPFFSSFFSFLRSFSTSSSE